MKKRYKYALSILTSLRLAFVFLQVLLYLFPYCGLQVIVSFGAHLFVAILAGIIFSKILSLNSKSSVKYFYATSTFIVMFAVQAQTYTQDVGEPTTTKIMNAIIATLNYNKIEEAKYLDYNDEEKIVYNAKFNKERNKEYFSLSNFNSGKKYFVTRQDNKLIYDKTILEIDYVSKPNLIIEIDENGNRTINEIGDVENLFEIKYGGYLSWSIEMFDTDLVGYEKILDELNRKK